MPSLKSSPPRPTKKPLAKKPSKAARSKPSATSATKSKKTPKAPTAETLGLLREYYPNAYCELNHRNPFELLVATVLSAQCTDVMVNKVTPALFEAYPTPEAMAKSKLEDVETLLRSIGLYKNKAKNIRQLAMVLVEKHQSEVPPRLEDLVELAGVGRKTANVVLGNAFGIASGIVVDTHVARLSWRFGWTHSDNVVQVEKDLQTFVEKDRWIQISHELIFHGRRICFARSPLCSECFMARICPKIGVESHR